MKIISIKEDPDNKGYKIISLSNGRDFSASEESLFKYALYKDETYDESYLNSVILSIEADDAYIRGLKYCYSKLRSEKEVRIKLSQLDFSNESIDLAIDKLKDRGYVDDKIYAEKYIKNAVKLSNKSSKIILFELEQKGIDTFYAERLLNVYEDRDNEMALKLLRKKIKTPVENISDDEMLKLKKYLYRKGFSFENINFAMEKLRDDEYNVD